MELSYFAIIIGAIFVNNVVLAQFLGICPFLGCLLYTSPSPRDS